MVFWRSYFGGKCAKLERLWCEERCLEDSWPRGQMSGEPSSGRAGVQEVTVWGNECPTSLGCSSWSSMKQLISDANSSVTVWKPLETTLNIYCNLCELLCQWFDLIFYSRHFCLNWHFLLWILVSFIVPKNDNFWWFKVKLFLAITQWNMRKISSLW